MATSSNLKYDYRVTNVGLAGAETFSVTLVEADRENAGSVTGPTPGTGNITLIVDRDTAKNITPGDVYTVTFAKN